MRRPPEQRPADLRPHRPPRRATRLRLHRHTRRRPERGRANDRRAWPAQHKAFQQALTEARWAVRAANLTPVVGANVTLHYRPTTRRRQDSDGIAPTLKPCLDALVQEGVLPDDSWVCVPKTSQEIHEPDGDAAMWLELDVLTWFKDGTA